MLGHYITPGLIAIRACAVAAGCVPATAHAAINKNGGRETFEGCGCCDEVRE